MNTINKNSTETFCFAGFGLFIINMAIILLIIHNSIEIVLIVMSIASKVLYYIEASYLIFGLVNILMLSKRHKLASNGSGDIDITGITNNRKAISIATLVVFLSMVISYALLLANI
ncbi:MAG: hypothetical protein N4A40_12780 [Tissierellales bacterium]|jgi:hypothetical protein|nr:hypothetical protein [Tissierellales bacterium]